MGPMTKVAMVFFVIACLCLTGCGDGSDSAGPAGGVDTSESPAAVDKTLKTTVLQNQAPYLPPQCYTRTVKTNGDVQNPCYTCHTRGFRPDFINDGDLQTEFAFPDYAMQNHWTNLFQDRSGAMSEITDDEILAYIRTSNYQDGDGRILPAADIDDLPPEWDDDGDGMWSGYKPDCHFHFDDLGFDRDPSGNYTGWRAFAYYPFPATHWPAGGDYGDVLIRLDKVFQTLGGRFDMETYRLNLAILEAIIKKRDVAIPPTDETRYETDLNKNGRLDTADRIAFDWAPNENRMMSYVGDARIRQQSGEIHLAGGLYPEGTEFLNTLRYVGVSDQGDIEMAPRMKEIRYARKFKWLTYAEMETLALNEVKERADFPDRMKLPIGNLEDGVSNGVGWVLQGFIEDQNGRLRPQTFEETASCIGCHGGIGATTDSTFAFARKLEPPAFQDGWYHWSVKGVKGLNEPKAEFRSAGVQYEYSFYLMYAGAGDEFRSNEEIQAAFFDESGMLKQEMAEKLHEDISLLLYPSRERALALNKVYKRIVAEQSYTSGRTPFLSKALNVFESLTPEDLETKVESPLVLTDRARDKACNPCVILAAEPASDAFQAVVDGSGMAGPDGLRYQIDPDGFIDESSYAVAAKGVYFPFPPRHTLPTRMIVPLGSIPVCYECHRLDRPVPPQHPEGNMPEALPEASSDEPGLTLVRLTEDSGTDVNGTWSPDGSRIAWETDRDGAFQIWVMNSDGSDPRPLTRGPAIHGWPQWRPDGGGLVYWGYDEASGTHTISTAAADGSDVRVIVESAEALDRPVWHPRGTHIAWAAQTDGNWDIWVADSDGAGVRRLTYDAQMESNPLWRPDGSYISYKVAPNKAYNLTVENFMDVENGFESPAVRQWDGIKSIQMNDWSPDGGKITYTAEIVTNASGEDRVSYLAVVEDVSFTGAKTSGTPVILSGHNTLGDRGPVFSPDGSQIAFWSWDKSYRATLWIAASDGSRLRQVTRQGPDMTPKWHPDGGRLLFESGRSGSMDIWTLAVE
ncbi:TolB family protein [Desulfococcus sp.]|uniref:TolB family protein n=1 Tax=Desulfococcus sp. TaxID=2025834 RepID=UPI00359360F2